jgi:hypothetical protein
METSETFTEIRDPQIASVYYEVIFNYLRIARQGPVTIQTPTHPRPANRLSFRSVRRRINGKSTPAICVRGSDRG